MVCKARCGLRRLINVLSSWETVLLFWMGAILRWLIVSGVEGIIWERKACKMIVLWWFEPLVRGSHACVGFHVWRCLFPLTLGLNLKKNVFLELIMICANKRGEKKQERSWKHAVRQNSKQTNHAVGNRVSSEHCDHRSAVVWLPARRSLCCLGLWCPVGCLPHPSLWKCSGLPLFLRDLQLHIRIRHVGLFSSPVWASPRSVFSSGKSSWVTSPFCLLYPFCLVSLLFGRWPRPGFLI